MFIFLFFTYHIIYKVDDMINYKIKKLAYILLLIVNSYLFLLMIPKIYPIISFIFKIIFPFLVAFIISFLLNPIVIILEKQVKKRWLAVLIVLLVSIIIIFFFTNYILNILINEVEELNNKLPSILKQLDDKLNSIINNIPLVKDFNINLYETINKYLNESKININSETINKLFSILKYIFITPIILIYFLLDFEKIKENIKSYLIKNNKHKLIDYLSDLNKTMISYFKGIFLVMTILFMTFSTVFLILKVENGLFFAFLIAITNIIPYLGSWIGTSIPVLYVLITDTNKAIIILIICIIIQTLESDFITPMIQGKQIKLHPLIVVLSLLVFGSLFGFLGMIIAVPISAILKVTMKHYPFKILKKT